MARHGWTSSPGNFGGSWCSPAPLYRYLSPKKNDSAATIDMTAFTFFTAACGGCHPGGGPAEFDRDGKRYDRWMSDPASGLTSGGDNNLDGDYYKAKWAESGVIEADCLLCHMPGYDYSLRRKQLSTWNFRWAATAGAKLATVTGSVQKDAPVEVVYNKALFNPDGTIEPHIVREPRNEACLSCHAQPGWKKRGANFSHRTDVHLRAGMRCTDCHPAGSSATDPRIAGHEVHQIGKGDDPGGLVRNDLDNTMVNYPMEDKRVVWVMDDRVYASGTEYRVVDKHDWETSPFANVHKYRNDISPAKAALGSGGCTDCHRQGADFFYAPALTHLFDESGQPVVEPQYRRLGLNENTVLLTACCQQYVKPGLFSLILFFPCALIAMLGGSAVQWVFGRRRVPLAVHFIPLVIAALAVVGTVMLLNQPDLLEYMLPTRMTLDANRFLIAVGVLLAGLVALLWQLRQWLSDSGQRRSISGAVTGLVLAISLAAAAVAGVPVFLNTPGLGNITRASHSVLDVSVTVVMVGVIVTVLHRVARQFLGREAPRDA